MKFKVNKILQLKKIEIWAILFFTCSIVEILTPIISDTFEELIFLELELPEPDKDKEPIIMKTYSFEEKNTYASLITEALNNFGLAKRTTEYQFPPTNLEK